MADGAPVDKSAQLTSDASDVILRFTSIETREICVSVISPSTQAGDLFELEIEHTGSFEKCIIQGIVGGDSNARTFECVSVCGNLSTIIIRNITSGSWDGAGNTNIQLLLP